MTVLDTQAPCSPPEPTAVATLRRQRRTLLAEARRCSHLRRLLRARLDLTVAEAVDAPAVRGDLEGVLAPASPLDVLVLSAMVHEPTADLVERLQDLELALRRLTAYTDVLHAEIDRATDALVAALTDDPSSCLDPGAAA